MFKEVFEDNCMPHIQVFEWHKQFSGIREVVENDSHSGQPVSFATEEKK